MFLEVGDSECLFLLFRLFGINSHDLVSDSHFLVKVKLLLFRWPRFRRFDVKVSLNLNLFLFAGFALLLIRMSVEVVNFVIVPVSF